MDNIITPSPKVTTGPLPSSQKVYVTPEAAPDISVPLREIELSSPAEPRVRVYDFAPALSDVRLLVPPLRLDQLRDLPLQVVGLVAGVPDQPEAAARPQHAGDLVERVVSREPVEGLGDGHGVRGLVRQRHALGEAGQRASRGHCPLELRPHLVNGLDGEDRRTRRDEHPRQLAGAGGEIDRGRAWSETELLREPVDGSVRVVGPGALVARGRRAEPPQDRRVNAHRFSRRAAHDCGSPSHLWDVAGKGGKPEGRRTVHRSTAETRGRRILPPGASGDGEAGLRSARAGAGQVCEGSPSQQPSLKWQTVHCHVWCTQRISAPQRRHRSTGATASTLRAEADAKRLLHSSARGGVAQLVRAAES